MTFVPYVGHSPKHSSHFSAEHQRNAASARHASTHVEHLRFQAWLEVRFRDPRLAIFDLESFRSVMRQKITDGELAGQYTVQDSTLLGWLREWVKKQRETVIGDDTYTIIER